MWGDAVLLLWSWLQGLKQDHTRGYENLGGDLQRPGQGCGKPWPRFMHSCVTNGMNLHFLDHAQPGSQDSEGGNTNNVTFGCSPPGCMLLRAGSRWDLSSQLQELTLREWCTFCDTYFLTARPPLSLASLVSASLSIIYLRMGFWRKSTGRLKFPPELRLRLRPLAPSFPQSSRIDLIFLWMAEQLWSNSVLDCKMAYRHLYSAGKPCLILTKYVGIFSDVCLSCCCCSVVKSCLALWSMDYSTPGFLPCPSLSPGVCSNPCPLTQWCHPTISSSVPPSPPALNFPWYNSLYDAYLHRSEITNIFFILGIMVYRDGGQIMSGQTKCYKRGVNHQSFPTKQGWEQRENLVYTSHGLPSPWETRHIPYWFPCLNEADVIIKRRVGKTEGNWLWKETDSFFCVRSKFPSVKAEKAGHGVNFPCFLSTANKNIL